MVCAFPMTTKRVCKQLVLVYMSCMFVSAGENCQKRVREHSKVDVGLSVSLLSVFYSDVFSERPH